MSVAKRITFDVPGFGRLHTTNGRITFAGDQGTLEKSDQGPAGISEEWMPGQLSFNVKNRPGISGVQLMRLRNIDVTVQDDGGKTWQCRGCSTTNQPQLADGDFAVEMSFEDQEEVL